MSTLSTSQIKYRSKKTNWTPEEYQSQRCEWCFLGNDEWVVRRNSQRTDARVRDPANGAAWTSRIRQNSRLRCLPAGARCWLIADLWWSSGGIAWLQSRGGSLSDFILTLSDTVPSTSQDGRERPGEVAARCPRELIIFQPLPSTSVIPSKSLQPNFAQTVINWVSVSSLSLTLRAQVMAGENCLFLLLQQRPELWSPVRAKKPATGICVLESWYSRCSRLAAPN